MTTANELAGKNQADYPGRMPTRTIEAAEIADRLDRFGLTSTQRAIILELVRGQTDAEIAGQLGLSNQTIRNEMSRILREVGVRNRLELTLVALGYPIIGDQ